MPKTRKQSEKVRRKKNDEIKKRSRKDESLRIKNRNQAAKGMAKLRENPDFKAKQDEIANKIMKKKRAENPEFDAEQKEISKKIMRKKRVEDPAFDAQQKESAKKIMKEKRKSPTFKIVESQKMREKRKVTVKAEAQKEKERLVMEEKRAASKIERAKKKAEKDEKKLYERQLKHVAMLKFREEKKEALKLSSKKLSSDEKMNFKALCAQRCLKFVGALREVPTEVCCCCMRLLFRKGVKVFNDKTVYESYIKNGNKLKKDLKYDFKSFDKIDVFIKEIVGYDSKYICHSCDSTLKKGKIPLYTKNSGIYVKKVHEDIENLTDLEERFVSPILLFMNIKTRKPFALNPQYGIKGGVVHILPDQTVFRQVLPVKMNQTGTVQVRLKRKLTHKTAYMFETISPDHIFKALLKLKKSTLFIKHGIDIDYDAFNEYDPSGKAKKLNFLVANENEDSSKFDYIAKDEDVKVENEETEPIKVENESRNVKNEEKPKESKSVDDKCKSPQKKSTSKVQNQYLMFKNCITLNYSFAKNDGKLKWTFSNLCSFNSSFHAFMAFYDNDDDFKQFIMNNDYCEYFKLIADLFANSKNKDKKWIEYILSKNPNILTDEYNKERSSSNSKNMWQDAADVLGNFLDNEFYSFTNTPKCLNCTLNLSQIVAPLISCVDLNAKKGVSIQNLRAWVNDGVKKFCAEHCLICQSTKIEHDVKFNDLVIINILKSTFNENETFYHLKLSKDIPKSLLLNNQEYELRILVNRPNESHYMSYYRDKSDRFMVLNDSPINQEYVSDAKNINPVVLVYYKVQKVKRQLSDESAKRSNVEKKIKPSNNENEFKNERTFKRQEKPVEKSKVSECKNIIFENSIDVKSEDGMIFTYENLNGFNCVLHPLIACYNDNEKFRKYVDENLLHISYFKFLVEVVKNPVGRNERWFNYICQVDSRVFTLKKKNKTDITYDMTSCSSTVLESILGSEFCSFKMMPHCYECWDEFESVCHSLIKVELRKCENEDFKTCLQSSIENEVQKLVKLPAKTNCKHEKINFNIEYNNMVFIDLLSDVEEIFGVRHNDNMPATLLLNNALYDLKIIISKTNATQYMSYLRNFNTYDYYFLRETPKKKEGGTVFFICNPSMLVYMKRNLDVNKTTIEPMEIDDDLDIKKDSSVEEMEVEYTQSGGVDAPCRFVLFENTFEAKFDNKILSFVNMCAFNATIHPFIAFYTLDKRFRNMTFEKKFINVNFFKLIKNAIERPNDRNQLFLDFICQTNYEVFQQTSNIDKKKSQISMWYDAAKALGNFLDDDFHSYKAQYNCVNAFCKKRIEDLCAPLIYIEGRTENYASFLPFAIPVDIKRFGMNKCPHCNGNVECQNIEYNDVIIFNIVESAINDGKSELLIGGDTIFKSNISVDIPNEIELNNETYELKIVVNKKVNHYNAYYRESHAKIIKLDEFPMRVESYVDENEVVNANVMVYIKKNSFIDNDSSFDLSFDVLRSDFSNLNINVENKSSSGCKSDIPQKFEQKESDTDKKMNVDNEGEEWEDLDEDVLEDLENMNEFNIDVDEIMVMKRPDGKDPGELDELLRTKFMVEVDEKSGKIINIAPGDNKKPILADTYPNIIELCFVKTFGGEPMTYDKSKVTFSKMAKYLVMHYDRRFARVPLVLYLVKEKLRHDIMQSINIVMRKNPVESKITVKDVLGKKPLDTIINENQAYKVFKKIRISNAYFAEKKLDAKAMLLNFGIPTFFLTSSIGDSYAIELLKQIHKNLYPEKPELNDLEVYNLSSHEKTKLVQQDPVTCTEFFDNRRKALKSFYRDKSGHGLFGENYVEHHFNRIEEQVRMFLHLHECVWCHDAPILNTYEEDEEKRVKNEKEITDFLDKHISTEFKPDHPFMGVHNHICNESCRRKNNKKCRYNFPQLISRKTKIIYPFPTTDDVEEIKKIKKLVGMFSVIKEKMYEYAKNPTEKQSFDDMLLSLKISENEYYDAIRASVSKITVLYKRESDAVMINTYNPILLDVLEANHDIQFVIDSYAAIGYLFKYCLKLDEGMLKSMSMAVKEAKDGAVSIREMFYKLGNVFHNTAFIGAQLAVSDIEGMHATEFSSKVKFVNTSIPSERYGILKSLKEMRSMDLKDRNIMKPDYIEFYAKRPQDMNDICLYEFAAWYEKNSTAKKKQKVLIKVDSDDDGEFLDTDSEHEEVYNVEDPEKCTYRRRRLRCVVRSCHFNEKQRPNDYIREMVMLYLPWRDEEKELLDNVTVAKTFKDKELEIFRMYRKYNLLNAREIDEYAEEIELKIKENAKFDMLDGLADDGEDEIENVDIFDELKIKKPKDSDKDSGKSGAMVKMDPPHVDRDELFELIRTLNEEQQTFVMHILNLLKIRQNNLRNEGKLITLLSKAGSGKTRVIKVLNLLVTYYFNGIRGENFDDLKALLCASTGEAAFQIEGVTMHGAFRLPICKHDYTKMNNSTKTSVHLAYKSVEVIIVDECSMISNNNFVKMETRLREIFGEENKICGGKILIVVGDLNQLEPVKGLPIFSDYFHGSNPDDLIRFQVWKKHCQLYELKKIVRQKHVGFQTALNNLSEGIMTQDDIKLIRERTVKDESVIPLEAIHLFNTNREVDSFNDSKILSLPGDLVTVNAKTSFKKLDGNPQHVINGLLKDYNKCYVKNGLIPELLLKIGVRYRILFNMDVKDGIVNGTNGYLRHISFNEKKLPLIIWLECESKRVGAIKRKPFIDYMKKNKIDLKLVPIQMVTKSMKLLNSQLSYVVNHTAYRTQFPVLPCEGITVHRAQGKTLPGVAAHCDAQTSSRGTNYPYTLLSRCDYEQLYIVGKFHPPTSSKNSSVKEMERLRKENPLQLSFYDFDQKDGIKIIYHNVNSFEAHKLDIKNHFWYWKADVVIFAECNVNEINHCDIGDNFNVVFPTSDDKVEKIRSQGLAILVRKGLFISNLSPSNIVTNRKSNMSKNDKPFNIDIRTFVISDHYVITGYKSPHSPAQEFYDIIKKSIENAPKGKFITLIGDFNVNMLKENKFASILKNDNLENCLGTASTTDAGTQIDIVFSNSEKGFAGTYASYFSDHFAVYYQTKIDMKKLCENYCLDNHFKIDYEKYQPKNKNVDNTAKITNDPGSNLSQKKGKNAEEKLYEDHEDIDEDDKIDNSIMHDVLDEDIIPEENIECRVKQKSKLIANTVRVRETPGHLIEYRNLCAFNSFLHGMISSCGLDEHFLNAVKQCRSNNDYLDIVVQLMECDNDAERCFLWINYLSKNIKIESYLSDRFYPFKKTSTLENVLSMVWNVDLMLKELFSSNNSCKKSSKCTFCHHERFKKIANIDLAMRGLNNNETFNTKFQELLKKYLENRTVRCLNCDKMNAVKYVMNSFVIIFPGCNNNFSTSISSVPRRFHDENSIEYELKFIVNFVANSEDDHSLNHFNTYAFSKDVCWHIDDLDQSEEIVSNENLMVNPIVMFFYKKSG